MKPESILGKRKRCDTDEDYGETSVVYNSRYYGQGKDAGNDAYCVVVTDDYMSDDNGSISSQEVMCDIYENNDDIDELTSEFEELSIEDEVDELCQLLGDMSLDDYDENAMEVGYD